MFGWKRMWRKLPFFLLGQMENGDYPWGLKLPSKSKTRAEIFRLNPDLAFTASYHFSAQSDGFRKEGSGHDFQILMALIQSFLVCI